MKTCDHDKCETEGCNRIADFTAQLDDQFEKVCITHAAAMMIHRALQMPFGPRPVMRPIGR